MVNNFKVGDYVALSMLFSGAVFGVITHIEGPKCTIEVNGKDGGVISTSVFCDYVRPIKEFEKALFI